MATRRVGQKVIDWAKLAASLPVEVRSDFLAFRGKYEATLARVNSYPEKPEPVDWQHYKKAISKSGFVDGFQKQYENLSIPYPKDTTSSKLAAYQKDVETQVQEVIDQSKTKVVELRNELTKIKAQKPYEDMTIDEYLADKPEIREQAEKDMKNHVWYIAKE